MPSLEKYRKMRDFERTAEPRGGKGKARDKKPEVLSYVVQRHDARRLHYDFRLELDGVLLSWAVPKGPSLDPAEKRLAVETEPHPLEYGEFEGEIAEGQYGAGTVMIWDRGTWEPEGDPRADYQRGRLTFRLRGQKLNGSWHLVRTGSSDRGGNGKDKKSWLLIKSRDDYARSGNGKLDDTPALPRARPPSKQAVSRPKAPEPELATLVTEAPLGDDWVHELKFDGYRLLVTLHAGKATLETRNGNDWTSRVPKLAETLARLEVDAAVLDGELVALDERGVSDFQRLQNSLGETDATGLVYYAFDLLHLNGKDLRTAALTERKRALSELFRGLPKDLAGTLRLSEHVVGQGPEFFRKACELGVEGIVSKRASAPYRPGRGRDWLKVKCTLRQEFVLVGYTDPGGSRSHFGALLLAVERDGSFVYSGRVGTGFTAASLAELKAALSPLGVRTPPVVNAPRGAQVRGVHWVRPELVAEVAFTGFTSDGLLRHPTFQGLRSDMSASEVHAEKPAPPEAAASADYPLTNPNKVLYPAQRITKRELLEYYALVAERMLPHVRNRPLTLVRCPNGFDKPCFFQKHPGEGVPEGVRSVPVREQEGKAPYSVIDDERGLFGLVQLGALEIHTWGSRADDYEHPDILVFDLDPDPSVPFAEVIVAARELRSTFERAKLESFVKTAGGKGLHVCVPILPELDWTQAKDFCRRVAEAMAHQHPDRYLATSSKSRRRGKIFVDYLRNGRGATFVAPYSTRARDGAPVAVPLEWDELDAKLRPDQWNVRNLRARLESQKADPFARLGSRSQSLRTLLADLEGEPDA
ncbi:MAG TPA: DNA ligase D [Polyangiaceae bacterium]|nr:DNA ligase D [Polyangiaceae bacterium]